MHSGIEHLNERFNDCQDAATGIAFCQNIGAMRNSSREPLFPAAGRRRRRNASAPDSIATRVILFRRNRNVRQFSKTCVDTVNDFTARNDTFNKLSRPFNTQSRRMSKLNL